MSKISEEPEIKTDSKEIDEEQNPKNEILNLLLTFDSFDVDTIKGDIYLEEKMGKKNIGL